MSRKTRLPLTQLGEGHRTLDESERHYLLRVRRTKLGGSFLAFDPESGHEAEGRVLTEEGLVELFGPTLAQPEVPLTWIHGLAKGDKCDAIVRDATELGATEIVFVAMARSVLDLTGKRKERRVERWQTIAKEAARQSERSRAPTVTIESWDRAVHARESAARICLYEGATQSFRDGLKKDALHHVFLAGPEGGIDPSEVEDLEAVGWTIVSLGTRILRTETVPAAVLGAVQLLGISPE